ncbi:MAG: winged helix-turn-helix domain-containing protein [Coriobacteriales bacterium]|nr:winged helix-turn-helix domain-containing protein [Coriobacteriales bacterium]
MHRKNVLVFSRPSGVEYRLRALFDAADVEVRFFAVPLPSVLKDISALEADLVVFEPEQAELKSMRAVEDALFSAGNIALFVVVNEADLDLLQLPSRLVADFATHESSDAELSLRLRHLLWRGEETSSADFVRAGSLTLNLATYQVKVDGTTLDLTYLEYALLAFLVTHPGKTYSRDALLRRVWGFEYFGGSRTVDVHVRRVRAKLGPELAQHLETVRGVGYLWNR